MAALLDELPAPPQTARCASAGNDDRGRAAGEPPGQSARQAGLTRLFAVTIFTSAFLGFALQPMVGRMILPKFGGTSAVWSSALLFFQATLLAGYAYSHLATAWLGVRRSTVLHLVVMLLPLLTLPVVMPRDWRPPAEANPVPWLLGYLFLSAGLPFLVVSTSAPLFQKWFAATGHAHSRNPYFLYAASNVGSLAGLLSYPILIEPTLGLRQQSWFWSAGYLLLAGLSGCCAIAVWRSRRGTPLADEAGHESQEGKPLVAIGFLTRLRWLVLAFFPSSLLLGVTASMSTDISPIPLLWVIPLSLYLLTFVVAFGRAPGRANLWLVWSLPLFIVLPLLLTFAPHAWHKSLTGEIAVHLAAFSAVCLVFHWELARRKPEPARLTEFYLWVSLGGVLGGVFNTLIAPRIFSTLLEYPLVLILAGLAMPCWRSHWPWLMNRRREMLAAGVVVVVTALLWWQGGSPFVKYGLPLLACALLFTRPWTFSLGVGIAYFTAISLAAPAGRHVFYQGRSFFGTFSVVGDEGGHCRFLAHGTTLHGAQWLDGDNRRIPLLYFDPTGPIGWIFTALRETPPRGSVDHVAIIGLGTGSLAAYGRSGEQFTFFEIDPALVHIARTQFTYLNDSPAACRVVVGDGRLSLMREADKKYNLIVFDAFNSDAVPTHLITREAMELYRDKLAEGGLIAVNITNKYLDLEPVVFAVGKASGLAVRTCLDSTTTPAARVRAKARSRWAILARREEDFRGLKDDPRWQRECHGNVGVWTDDYSNVIGSLRLSGLP